MPDHEGWRQYAPNAFGNWVLSRVVGAFTNVTGKIEEELAIRRLRRCRVALTRFENAEGRLPDSLEELVPRFLDTVPLDVYDGKPIRYDAARGAVWVIGEDLRDDGGELEFDPELPARKMSDPTIFVHDYRLQPKEN